MKKNRIYLGIGTNLGDREKNIYKAWVRLGRCLYEMEAAALFRSTPMYMEGQPEFLNTVFTGMTELSAPLLLREINQIEEELGRVRDTALKMGPRVIDIDILLYGKMVIDTERLKVPHPLMKEREFVLKPLTDLAPDIKDPATGESYTGILEQKKGQGVYYQASWGYILNKYKKD